MKLIAKMKKFINSSFGYLPVKVFEGIVGIVTLRVYTGLFSTDTYGDYSTINPYINIIYLIFISWVATASIRYVNKYAKGSKTQQEEFFSTYFILWGSLIVAASVFLGLSTLFLPTIFSDNSLLMVVSLILVLIGYSANQNLLSLLYYADKRLINIILVILSSLGKLILTIVLFQFIGETVLAIFLSHGIINMTIGIIAFFSLNVTHRIRLKCFSKKLALNFTTFGIPLIGNTLAMALLNFSDRYIIDYYFGNSMVGIYSANYTLPASVFTMIMLGMNRSYYPNLIKAYNNKDTDLTNKRLRNGTKNYLLIALPAATGMYLLSSSIATLTLDEKYTSGNQVIGIIAVAMLFLGLVDYVNKGWELKGKTIFMLINCLIATLINIVLNIFFVDDFGYIFAAYTTLIANIAYFLISYLNRNKSIHFGIEAKSLARLLVSTLFMGIVVWLVTWLIDGSILSLVIAIFLGIISYFAALYLTGEIKSIRGMLHSE